MPGSVIALLADTPSISSSSSGVCTVQWSLALVSCLTTILTLAATAMDNYARLLMPSCYIYLSPCHITCTVLFIWMASVAVVVVQIVYNQGPDYCHRTSHGLVPYQIVVGVCFVVIPTLITILSYGLLIFRQPPSSPMALNADFFVVKSNIFSFLLFVVFWLPFGSTLVLSPLQFVSRRLFYNLAWFALSKSCVNNLLYCATNRFFRHAYVNLFHYCCCKTTVSFSRRSREQARPPGDVRVHIIPAYNINYSSPNRAREGHNKGSGKRPIAYEL